MGGLFEGLFGGGGLSDALDEQNRLAREAAAKADREAAKAEAAAKEQEAMLQEREAQAKQEEAERKKRQMKGRRDLLFGLETGVEDDTLGGA